ncbi:hypothetical protein ACTXI4_04750 [Glutamicibacter ardleyensis]|uniref:hypothetical protein n=1 Tax=Glutamicibacter ardleyensis TaxID=225894 RepID=UPI003FD29D72
MHLQDLTVIPILVFLLGAAAVIFTRKKMKEPDHEQKWTYLLLSGSVVSFGAALAAWI